MWKDANLKNGNKTDACGTKRRTHLFFLYQLTVDYTKSLRDPLDYKTVQPGWVKMNSHQQP